MFRKILFLLLIIMTTHLSFAKPSLQAEVENKKKNILKNEITAVTVISSLLCATAIIEEREDHVLFKSCELANGTNPTHPIFIGVLLSTLRTSLDIIGNSNFSVQDSKLTKYNNSEDLNYIRSVILQLSEKYNL